METIGDYINKITEEGYIGTKGEPLKCYSCGGNNFHKESVCYDNMMLCEYDMICSCGTIVGHWAYGNWDI